MGYQTAMEMAGAKVLEVKQFGSYQGEWWALVEYQDKKGWVNGSYGSCSGRDAFQAEFGYSAHLHQDNNYCNPMYDGFVDNCENCQDVKQRLMDFGKSYLEHTMTQEQAIKAASENLAWDFEAQEMVDFIKEHNYGK